MMPVCMDRFLHICAYSIVTLVLRISDESEGLLLFSYLYVLFYKFLLSMMPVCI
jgi:hypothetical protein